MNLEFLYTEALLLLKQLIATPSFSKQENETAILLEQFFAKHEISCQRIGSNVYAQNLFFDEAKPTILLNSHHDTVKPNAGYTLNPFEAIENGDTLFGLGCNDAGGCLVSLISTFLHFYNQQNLKYNLIIAATAEEEISGTGGVEMLLPHLPKIDFAIVGEPTLLQMAVAERGLMVLDCVANGKAGHAARNEGENALYKAIKDIEWFTNYKFQKHSTLLGDSKFTVTVIKTENKQHNVVPAQCKFVVDVRVNELYTFDELLQIINENVSSVVTARSTRLKSTSIAVEHPIVQAGLALGKTYYGSPTTSDKALMPFPALKIGPGDSARSHTADEFIYLHEIKEGIKTYINLLQKII